MSPLETSFHDENMLHGRKSDEVLNKKSFQEDWWNKEPCFTFSLLHQIPTSYKPTRIFKKGHYYLVSQCGVVSGDVYRKTNWSLESEKAWSRNGRVGIYPIPQFWSQSETWAKYLFPFYADPNRFPHYPLYPWVFLGLKKDLRVTYINASWSLRVCFKWTAWGDKKKLEPNTSDTNFGKSKSMCRVNFMGHALWSNE